MEEKEVILTKEGFEKLEQELNYLKTEKKNRSCRKNKSCIRIRRFIRKFRI